METPEEQVERIVAERKIKPKTRRKKTPATPAVPQGGRNPNGTFAKGIVPEGSSPFPPGVSGNPAGRPPFAAALVRLGGCESTVRPGMTRVDSAADALLMKAEGGDVQAFKEAAERTEGKVAQELNLANKDGEAFEVVVSDPAERLAREVARFAPIRAEDSSDSERGAD